MTGLELFSVTARVKDGSALFAPLSLRVDPGEIATVMGASGVGKSTLINLVGGHLPANLRGEGRVLLNGSEVTGLPAEARRIGVLFQDPVLFPHMTVGENLAFGLAPGLRGRLARRAAIADALSQAGLDGFEARDPATLSGGQKARVALLRTLLAGPRALLLDEPFSKLDPQRRGEIRDFVFNHARTRRLPVLLVSHDAQDAEAAGGPVVTLAAPAP